MSKQSQAKADAHTYAQTHHQEQQLQQQPYNRDEEYLQAKRSAVETLAIGRGTLEASVGQGEQLRNAEDAAEATEYKLDRATRLLRGMTWSGWLANKFSSDVPPPEYRSRDRSPYADPASGALASRLHPPTVYENVPGICQQAAQAVQNYNANLFVLEACESDDQRQTCALICDNMFQVATRQLKSVKNRIKHSDGTFDKDVVKMIERLSTDLATLRNKQLDLQKLTLTVDDIPSGPSAAQQPRDEETNKLFKGARRTDAGAGSNKTRSATASASQPVPPAKIDPVMQQQDDHLNFMAHHLGELGAIAQNLNQSLTDQNRTLESLDNRSETVMFKTKMVTRRADRIIQKNSWAKTKPEFVSNVSVRHVATGKYLAVSVSNGLTLSDKLNETCIFGYWKRQGGIFGMQSRYSRKWAGQSLLGKLSCNANAFGRREEWDADGEWSETSLLCASAGWGNGGYLLATPDRDTVVVGGGGLVDKKQADQWCIAETGA